MFKFINENFLKNKKKIKSYSTKIFDNHSISFLDNLSKSILSNINAKKYPDLVSFGFWCRGQNLKKLSKNYIDGNLRKGHGLIFHICPSNVPINFMYSFSFGLLAGNSNIVRLPTKPFPQNEILLKIIKKLLSQKKFRIIKERTLFIKYEPNEKITNYFSKLCTTRVIWGGDNTIKNIRNISLQAKSLDVPFTDKYSFTIIDLQKLNKLSQENFIRVVKNYYNDNYTMDQNACSSSHLVIWIGSDNKKLRIKFWSELNNICKLKYKMESIGAIDKYNKFFSDISIIKNIKNTYRYGSNVYVINLLKIDKDIDNYRGKWGYFYETNFKKFEDIFKYTNEKCQTISYFGFEKLTLMNFIKKNNFKGVDRIVPIGQSLDMGLIWDGYDLIRTLSRVVEIK